jgi:hypothetical protein
VRAVLFCVCKSGIWTYINKPALKIGTKKKACVLMAQGFSSLTIFSCMIIQQLSELIHLASTQLEPECLSLVATGFEHLSLLSL